MLIRPFVESTFASLAATLIVFTLGMGFGRLVSFLSERYPLRRMLGLCKDNLVCIVIASPTRIIPGTTDTMTTEGVPLTPIGPVFAYERISNLLATAYPKMKNVRLYFSTDFPHELYSQNLILIGFPKANQVTKEIMTDIELPLVFDEHALVEKNTGRVAYQATIHAGEVRKDFGCLVRVPNPYQSRSRVFILAGCQTYGVKAAADFLAAQNLLELWNIKVPGLLYLALTKFSWLVPSRFTNEYYQIVVSVQVRQHFTSQPELVAYHPLNPK